MVLVDLIMRLYNYGLSASSFVFVFDENGNFVDSFRICLLFKFFKPFTPVIDYGLNQHKLFTINLDTKGGLMRV